MICALRRKTVRFIRRRRRRVAIIMTVSVDVLTTPPLLFLTVSRILDLDLDYYPPPLLDLVRSWTKNRRSLGNYGAEKRELLLGIPE